MLKRQLVEFFVAEEPFSIFLVHELYNYYLQNASLILKNGFVTQSILDMLYHNPFVFDDATRNATFLDKTYPILLQDKGGTDDLDFDLAVYFYLAIISSSFRFPKGVSMMQKFILENPNNGFIVDVSIVLKQKGDLLI